MPQQFLTNPDGSVPAGIDVAALLAAGVLLVRPTPPPTPAPNQVPRDTCDPTLTNGVYYQRWELETLPPPPPVRVITPTEFLTRLPASRAEILLAAAESTLAGKLWVMRLVAASVIDLDDPETVGALTQLRQAGVLTQQDVDDLLA